MSDHRGDRSLVGALPVTDQLVAERRSDSDRFRAALEARGIRPRYTAATYRYFVVPQ